MSTHVRSSFNVHIEQVEQLSEGTGEESLILTASISDGSFSHLGSKRGKIFLQNHETIKTQFLGFCLTGTYMYNLTL